MSDSNSNLIKCKSEISFNEMKRDIKILKYINIKNNETAFSKFYKKKDNKSIISNLLNSNKKLIKNYPKYKSCTDLPKTFQYLYPYKPKYKRRNISSKIQSEHSNSDLSLISYFKTFDLSKRTLLDFKKFPKENKLNSKKFSLIYNNKVNETIFLDFIQGCNIDTKVKEEYNNYIKKHPIIENNNTNIFKLFDLLQNFKIDYNYKEKDFYDDKSLSKINEFKINNDACIKIKISSLKIIFYKIKNKNELINKEDNLSFENNSNFKNVSINYKIKFPFEFMPFFYGINNIDFLRFLIAIIDYDYSKNIFFMDFKKFIKVYLLYKQNTTLFGEGSYCKKFYKKEPEFFIYNWDIKSKEKNNISHYIMKIILPQMKISINSQNKISSKFYISLDSNKIIYFLKEKFKLWDFYVLKYFSEYKIFRKEFNKIIYHKDIMTNNLEEINKVNNNISNINNKYYKKKFNLNKIKTIPNNSKERGKTFEFFFSQNINNINEGYFFQIKIPKVHISYEYRNNNVIDKYFDLDIKQMIQMNKLRKYFKSEDLVKYSMAIVNEKTKSQKRKCSSVFEMTGRRNIKKSSTLHYSCNPYRLSIRTASTRLSANEKDFIVSEKLKFLRAGQKKLTIKKIYHEKEPKKDIELNLDKYIFNFDDDILKFIKPNLNENINKLNNDMNNIKSVSNSKRVEKNLNIEIGKIKLFWTCQDLEEYEYCFEEKESQYLLKHPFYIWEKFIENNFNEYKNKAK